MILQTARERGLVLSATGCWNFGLQGRCGWFLATVMQEAGSSRFEDHERRGSNATLDVKR
jgi:hypothetical protein